MKNRPEHPEHIDECERVFITWRWGIIAVLGSIGLIVSAVFGYVKGEKDQDVKIIAAEHRIEKVESIKQDMDTLKTLLRRMVQ